MLIIGIGEHSAQYALPDKALVIVECAGRAEHVANIVLGGRDIRHLLVAICEGIHYDPRRAYRSFNGEHHIVVGLNKLTNVILFFANSPASPSLIKNPFDSKV